MSEKYGIRFTIPDLPVGEQIKMIKDMRFVVETFAKLTGETPDLKPFDDAIAKLAPKPKKRSRL